MGVCPRKQFFLFCQGEPDSDVLNQCEELLAGDDSNFVFVSLIEMDRQLLGDFLFWQPGLFHHLDESLLVGQEFRVDVDPLLLGRDHLLPENVRLPLALHATALVSSPQVEHCLPHQQLLPQSVVYPFLCALWST